MDSWIDGGLDLLPDPRICCHSCLQKCPFHFALSRLVVFPRCTTLLCFLTSPHVVGSLATHGKQLLASGRQHVESATEWEDISSSSPLEGI